MTDTRRAISRQFIAGNTRRYLARVKIANKPVMTMRVECDGFTPRSEVNADGKTIHSSIETLKEAIEYLLPSSGAVVSVTEV
jgi:hypothetical protein